MARESLGAAIAVAARLDHATGAALLQTARIAFDHGFTVILAIAAVVLTVAAGLSAVLLRDRVRRAS
ncbi:hypothetical protein ACFQYP_17460 [Nonomuraea antimicrobica]